MGRQLGGPNADVPSPQRGPEPQQQEGEVLEKETLGFVVRGPCLPFAVRALGNSHSFSIHHTGDTTPKLPHAQL